MNVNLYPLRLLILIVKENVTIVRKTTIFDVSLLHSENYEISLNGHKNISYRYPSDVNSSENVTV